MSFESYCEQEFYYMSEFLPIRSAFMHKEREKIASLRRIRAYYRILANFLSRRTTPPFRAHSISSRCRSKEHCSQKMINENRRCESYLRKSFHPKCDDLSQFSSRQFHQFYQLFFGSLNRCWIRRTHRDQFDHRNAKWTNV